jgi:hypothetical protein
VGGLLRGSLARAVIFPPSCPAAGICSDGCLWDGTGRERLPCCESQPVPPHSGTRIEAFPAHTSSPPSAFHIACAARPAAAVGVRQRRSAAAGRYKLSISMNVASVTPGDRKCAVSGSLETSAALRQVANLWWVTGAVSRPSRVQSARRTSSSCVSSPSSHLPASAAANPRAVPGLAPRRRSGQLRPAVLPPSCRRRLPRCWPSSPPAMARQSHHRCEASPRTARALCS